MIHGWKKEQYRVWLNYFTAWLIALVLTASVLVTIFGAPHMSEKDNMNMVRIPQNADNMQVQDEENIAAANSVNFVECREFDIRHLIKNYYISLSSGEREELSKYVDDTEGFSDEFLQENKDYVEEYMDIQCYYMEGMMPGTYLVAAYSYVKYYGVATTAAHIDEFYVCSNANGRYYICKKDVGEEITSYNEIMFGNQQIADMHEMADQERSNAISEDSSLGDLLEITGL
jgi:hypothetical protein